MEFELIFILPLLLFGIVAIGWIVRGNPLREMLGGDDYKAARTVAYREWERLWTIMGGEDQCRKALERMEALEAWAESQPEPTRSAYLYWAGYFKGRQREQIRRRVDGKRRKPFEEQTPRPPR